MTELPRKSWSVGAERAYAGFVDQYGKDAGTRAFYAYANKHGDKSLPLNERVSRFYAKGKHQTKP